MLPMNIPYKMKTFLLMVGALSALLSLETQAAAVNLAVSIQQTNDDGSLVTGTAGTKLWDLSNSALWSSTTTDGHVLNDLISTSLRWKNGAGGFDTTAGVYVNNLTFDVDPVLSFDFTLTNNTAFNQTYSLSYNTPLFPNLSGVVNSSANLTAVLKDAGGLAGAKITPANGNGNIMRSWDLTLDQNQISKNVDIGSFFSIASGTATNNWTATNTLDCGTGGGACETMLTVLTLTLSKGDQVRLYGDVTQEQPTVVPLPASVWFFSSAIAFLMMRMRRKKAVK